MEYLSKQEADALANSAADKAVTAMLQKLGMDTENVLETQKDQAYLRQQRLASEQVTKWSKRIILGMFLSSLFGIFWAGFKAALSVKS
ncbi:hypothetical protein MO867_18850 [Microbulbifer sp. OS29]|uniref:Uncharacterized protein n=1 Tax=Microbulbifer okhotskensis TaxID=2926617 RepID=A0A9X2EV03_9GAMM|nr:hypothetical protein [Microbulbifer okhotskensis]MCO1336396.1 hypothetical protein [Microbulbifer okhotskensis]